MKKGYFLLGIFLVIVTGALIEQTFFVTSLLDRYTSTLTATNCNNKVLSGQISFTLILNCSVEWFIEYFFIVTALGAIWSFRRSEIRRKKGIRYYEPSSKLKLKYKLRHSVLLQMIIAGMVSTLFLWVLLNADKLVMFG